ncbi:IS3 family transposase [Mycoplasmopsis mustelae]|uniref:IS3 family transposase n=1 Tax=Mycoplasmopsis mustelae TaxID=171289 RepID=UPI0038CDAEBD
MKSKCLNLYDLHKLTFSEIYQLISDYVKFYNNQKFQSALGWKTPQESWGALNL